jgi:hypothetical protein
MLGWVVAAAAAVNSLNKVAASSAVASACWARTNTGCKSLDVTPGNTPGVLLTWSVPATHSEPGSAAIARVGGLKITATHHHITPNLSNQGSI